VSLIPNPQSLIPFLLVATLAGCGKPAKPLPPTYPVHGRVTYKDGAPVRDGFVQFQPASDAWVTTAGAIQSDGTYNLTTMRDHLRADGAVAGPNRVTVVAAPSGGQAKQPLSSKMSRSPEPYVFPTPYTIQPRDNVINLTVPNASPH
jgi:hypothetical protein